MNNSITPTPTTSADNADLRGRLDRLEALVLAVVGELVSHLAAEPNPSAARRAVSRDGGGRIRQDWRN